MRRFLPACSLRDYGTRAGIFAIPPGHGGKSASRNLAPSCNTAGVAVAGFPPSSGRPGNAGGRKVPAEAQARVRSNRIWSVLRPESPIAGQSGPPFRKIEREQTRLRGRVPHDALQCPMFLPPAEIPLGTVPEHCGLSGHHAFAHLSHARARFEPEMERAASFQGLLDVRAKAFQPCYAVARKARAKPSFAGRPGTLQDQRDFSKRPLSCHEVARDPPVDTRPVHDSRCGSLPVLPGKHSSSSAISSGKSPCTVCHRMSRFRLPDTVRGEVSSTIKQLHARPSKFLSE